MHELMSKMRQKAGLLGYKRKCSTNLFKLFALVIILIISSLAINRIMSNNNNSLSYENGINNLNGNNNMNFFIDSSKLSTQSNYVTCHELESIDQEVQQEMDHSLNAGVRYKKMQDNDKMFPKLEKTGIFVMKTSTRHYYASEIISAKRRLFKWMTQLCLAQLDANRKYTTSSISSSDNIHKEGDVEKPVISSLQHKSPSTSFQSSSSSSSSLQRRGIIYTGGSHHFKNIYQSIYALHLLHVLLPVEIYINQYNVQLCKDTIIHLIQKNNIQLNVNCKGMSNHIQKFESKFHALLLTTFTDVLFLDADNLVVRDITTLFFESPQYREYGIILWPDLWGESCRHNNNNNNNNNDRSSSSRSNSNSNNNNDNNNDKDTNINPSFGSLGFSTNVLYAAGFGHLSWENTIEKAQETESGQFVINLHRHRGLIKLGLKIYQDRSFFTGKQLRDQGLFYGDKDIFRLIFLIMKEPVYIVPYFPSYSIHLKMNSPVMIHTNNDINIKSNENDQSKVSEGGGRGGGERGREGGSVLIASAYRDNLVHYFPYTMNNTTDNDNDINHHHHHHNHLNKRNSSNNIDVNDVYNDVNDRVQVDIKKSKKTISLPIFFHQLKVRQSASFEYILSVDDDNIHTTNNNNPVNLRNRGKEKNEKEDDGEVIHENNDNDNDNDIDDDDDDDDNVESIASVCMPFPSTSVIDILYKRYLHTKYNHHHYHHHHHHDQNKKEDTMKKKEEEENATTATTTTATTTTATTATLHVMVAENKNHNHNNDNLTPVSSSSSSSSSSQSLENQQLFNGYTPLKLVQLEEAEKFKKLAEMVFIHVDRHWMNNDESNNTLR